MKKQKFNIVLWKEKKFFVSQCLDVDISSFGKTKKEALANIKEALELYFEEHKPAKYTPVEQPQIVPVELVYA